MYDKNKLYQESVKEKLTFGPIDKYVKYDRFPTKLFIHILLVTLTTILTLSLATGSNSKFKSQREVWFNLVGLDPFEPRNHLYVISDFQTQLNNTLNNLANLNTIVFQELETSEAQYSINVEYLYPGAHLQTNNISHLIKEGNIFKYKIPNINEGITFPFNLSDTDNIKIFIQEIKSFTFIADMLKLRRMTSNNEELHSCWKLNLDYTMNSYSHIMTSLTAFQKNCEDHDEELVQNHNSGALRQFDSFKKGLKYTNETSKIKKNMILAKESERDSFTNIFILLNVLIFFLAFFSMILNWRYIYEMMNLYMDTRIRSKRKNIKNVGEQEEEDPSYLIQMISGKGEKSLEKLLESQKPWDKLTFREKLLFFDLWFIFCIVGNFIQIWASILSITSDLDFETYKTKVVVDVLNGFSCWFAWLNLLRYLEYNKNIHLLTNVMKNSGPQIIRFMIGFLPIFFAYVFMGVCLFWRYTKFETVNEAIITLFSIIMGDLVFVTFTEVIGVGILGEIYLFSFIIMFIICVHNIFVSIICSKAQEKKEKKVAQRSTQQIQTPPIVFQKPVYCDCCKKIMEKEKENNFEDVVVQEKMSREKGKLSDFFDNESIKNSPNTNNRKLVGTAWENIAKGFQIKKYSKNDENTGKLFLNKYEKFEELRKKFFDQMDLYRREINYLLEGMRKDAIEDVDLYELKIGQTIALKKKYKQQMEYLKSKIKSLIEPLKL